MSIPGPRSLARPAAIVALVVIAASAGGCVATIEPSSSPVPREIPTATTPPADEASPLPSPSPVRPPASPPAGNPAPD
ncbi:MAG: hypothetical protein QOK05_2467 [Chloroflexota bacterium]|jgi:hypothetical protein|nr:hypothetical protein [Chloroflexota bacterium]